jgi:peptidoglycan L-alanyl-D-glutamate endopeptidase CwlK
MTRTEVLKTLNPNTGEALSKALVELDSTGVRYFISEGGRTLLTQCLYALQGRLGEAKDAISFTDLEWACQKAGIRPPGKGIITKTLKSNHLDGNAVDMVPLKEAKDKEGNTKWEVDWNSQDDRIVVAMKNAGFIWGGDWKDFPDKPHFECRGTT